MSTTSTKWKIKIQNKINNAIMKNLVFIFLLIPFLSFAQVLSFGQNNIPSEGTIEYGILASSDLAGYDYDVDFSYQIKGDTLIVTKTKQYYSIYSCLVNGCTANHEPEPEVTKSYYLIEHLFDMKGEKQLIQKMVKETVFKRVD